MPDKKALFLATFASRVAVREITVAQPGSDTPSPTPPPAETAVAAAPTPAAADPVAPFRFENDTVRLDFPGAYKQPPDVKNTTYLMASDEAGNSYVYVVKVLPTPLANRPSKTLLTEEQRQTLQTRDTSKVTSSKFRKVSGLPALVLSFESNDPSEGPRKHFLAIVDRNHVLHTISVSGPPDKFDQQKVDRFLASFQFRSASGKFAADTSVANFELPRGLLNGRPTVPKVPSEDSAKPPLRIAVEIWGTDELRLFSDRVEWVHGSHLFPFRVLLNKVEWFPKKCAGAEARAKSGNSAEIAETGVGRRARRRGARVSHLARTARSSGHSI